MRNKTDAAPAPPYLNEILSKRDARQALTLASLLQRKAAQAGIKLTIPALLEQLSDITEVINLYAPQSGRGRLRAEYVLSERSDLQDKLCRVFDVYQLAHS